MYTDVSAIYGISESEIYAEWVADAKGRQLGDWLAMQYAELGRQNPHGGWDAENAPDFEALADQIERAACA